MSDFTLFTSESVSEGHPDKLADQISDAILDALLKEDPGSRVALETFLTRGLCVVGGELTTEAYVEIADIVRETICEVGYTHTDSGFDGYTCGVMLAIQRQSPDIAQGVDRADPNDQGAGDQGLMFGYATQRNRATDAARADDCARPDAPPCRSAQSHAGTRLPPGRQIAGDNRLQPGRHARPH